MSTFNKTVGQTTGWQARAWEYLRDVPELHYYVSWRAWSVSRCRITASALDESGEPVGSIPDDDPNAARVRELAADIAGGAAGQAQLMQRFAFLVSVIGECWIGVIQRDVSREEMPDGTPLPPEIGRPGYPAEQWLVFGREQISNTPNGLTLKLPDGVNHEFDPKLDTLFRVWVEHPRDPTQPVSAVWANLVVLNEIQQATATIDAAQRSRLIGNGIMFVPQEMSLPRQQAPKAERVPGGGTDPDDDPMPMFESGAQTLQDLIYEIATTAANDPSSLAGLMPLIAAVPGEQVKNAQWLRPATEVPETAIKTRNDAIRRFAMGVDMAPERLMGVGETSNHWSAWFMDESDVRIHVAPLAELLCNALNRSLFRYKLVEEGLDPDAYLLWYDTAALTQDPDKTEEAKDAFDRGAIDSAALREHLGFADTAGYDLTTADGWIALACDKIAADPANAQIFFPILQAAVQKVGLELEEPQAPALPPGAGDGEEDDPPSAEPGTEDDPPAAEQNVSASAAVNALGRYCVNRALEMANKRRRTRSTHELYAGIAIESAHTRLPRAGAAEVPDMIAGWDTGLVDRDLEDLGLSPAAFRDAVTATATLALISSTEPLFTRDLFEGARRVPV